MVQPAEKIRLGKWQQLPLLPVSELHFWISPFFSVFLFDLHFANVNVNGS